MAWFALNLNYTPTDYWAMTTAEREAIVNAARKRR